MNNYFNFKIPEFNEKYGSDWTVFKTIVDDNVDYLYKKIIDLYRLIDINRMPLRALEWSLDRLKIPYSVTDTMNMKKVMLRAFVAKQKGKGLQEIYLEVARGITGITGTIYNGYDRGRWKWGVSKWSDGTVNPYTIKWGSEISQFVIFFDVKTTDSTELDQIQELLQQKSLKPAYYQIYLVDSSFTILRTI